MGSRQYRPVQTLGAGHVEVGLVDGGHFDQGRKSGEDGVNFLRVFQVAVAMAVNKHGVRTELGSGAQGHGGMYAELARLVGGSSYDSTLVALASNDDSFTFER